MHSSNWGQNHNTVKNIVHNEKYQLDEQKLIIITNILELNIRLLINSILNWTFKTLKTNIMFYLIIS